MNSFGTKTIESPHMISDKCFIRTQILLRVLAAAFTLAAACSMFTSKETVHVFNTEMDARYSYSSALKFFAYANIIGCAFSILSLFLVSIFSRKGLHPKNYFYVFLHDMILMALLLAGTAAATTIGFVGKYGENQSGWMPICDSVPKFCHKVIKSIIFGFLGVIFYLCLTIISANQSRKIQV
ncbi:PREDICTED: CASP-like protein 1F1 [Nicotiana attenuata]|uniref:CASP-like protein n=1 Tax=Nicotiana attenuata TaxID=49451 RepID=A0A1J6KUT0_NICAT|nr:PREDICTED: CASP-like protein 1F1 [Nicotiana attenuata]OIT22849.1 casp-like protein 1f1 [Nicotiana attenuata]